MEELSDEDLEEWLWRMREDASNIADYIDSEEINDKEEGNG